MAKIDPKKQYRATETLFSGRARAANVGDIVEGSTIANHDENAEKHELWADRVEVVKADDQAAAASTSASPSGAQG